MEGRREQHAVSVILFLVSESILQSQLKGNKQKPLINLLEVLQVNSSPAFTAPGFWLMPGGKVRLPKGPLLSAAGKLLTLVPAWVVSLAV